jgi:hypothetical protein
MTQVIIYKQDNGAVAVVMPTQEALDAHGIMAVAIKDVPEGKPFKIVDASELPNEPQETWTVDEADLTDGIGGESNAFN